MAVLNTTSPTPGASAPSGRPTNARPSSSTSAANLSAGNDHRLVDAVLLQDLHFDPLGVGGGDVLAHVVRPDGQLAMPAVHQHRQLNGAGAAELDQCVHRRTGGAAVVDDVIHQHDPFSIHVRHAGGGVVRGLPKMEVVAVPAGIDGS